MVVRKTDENRESKQYELSNANALGGTRKNTYLEGYNLRATNAAQGPVVLGVDCQPQMISLASKRRHNQSHVTERKDLSTRAGQSTLETVPDKMLPCGLAGVPSRVCCGRR